MKTNHSKDSLNTINTMNNNKIAIKKKICFL